MTTRGPSSATRSRLIAALSLSVLVHLSMPLVLSGGSARHAATPAAARMLSVRIIAEEAAPEPPLVREPVVRAEAPPQPVQRPAPREPEPRTEVATAAPRPQSEGALPAAPDLTYYPTRQLDVLPRPLSKVDIQYRGKAAEDGVSGRVTLLIMIDEAGVVRDASIVRADPPHYFEEEAAQEVMALRFAPGYRQGRAVRSRLLVSLDYGTDLR